ncbi:uncharacterized protein LOC127634891 isoform X1 [Xyrauchen texanus]|uniref:uncharacterized protein LOC127634891 isoform X1 n=1 Tax=Xyrauchen texanus TaxID=154827 RepID=UPI002241E972|nr:uncharacterized protein LOC127634891 isoform X1 [Xyrauchen texanus]XP_051970595.1 uncharacterized protein LOC127634891 isoform X1 [Xyrauchen texanus]
MAIPTMSHSSRLQEVSTLVYLDEGASTSGTECRDEARAFEEAGQVATEEVGISYIMGQPRGEERQTFGFTCTENSIIQSCASNRFLSETKREKKASLSSHKKDTRTRWDTSRDKDRGQKSWKDKERKKRSRSEANVRQRNNPKQKNGRSSRCSKHRINGVVRFCSTPGHLSWPQQVTQTPDLQNTSVHLWDCPQEINVSISRLFLHGMKAELPSTFESQSTISNLLEPKSDSESAYIYAESIKCCDSSCCTFLADCDAHSLCSKDHIVNRPDTLSVWNSFDEAERLSRDSDFKESDNLSVSNDYKSSSNTSGYSMEATAGSESSRYGARFKANCFESFSVDDDFDSTYISTDEDWRCDIMDTDCHYSLAGAEWGSASSVFSNSSESSCYTADRDSESSYCSIDRRTYSSDSDSCVLEGLLGESSVKGFEKIYFDSLNTHSKNGSCDVFVPEFEGCFDSYDKEDVHRHTDNETSSDSESVDCPELWGFVTQTDRRHFLGFFREMIKEAAQEKDKEKKYVNEGFLFHPKQFLQVKNSEYREGREYSFLRHIQNGSYGDVFSIRDKQTGFTCAAKRIPLCSFRWEEVETWSRLDSPRVLQLYGAVREGPNVILFMDLKRGSLAQLMRVRGPLSEELALFYHSQVLQALEHLHSRRVVHLDVKVDNVLLSEDGRQCFLCDFGLSETLNLVGYSTKTFRGNILRGTESHMPPEVARGDIRSAKADVWSSCCMLLHLLNGHQPWTQYYTHPLYLKIVSEPPPLWEIPSDCDPLTCDVIKGGLVKEPIERDSASELLQKTYKALRTVRRVSGPEETTRQHVAPVSEDWPNVLTTQKTPDFTDRTIDHTLPSDLPAPSVHWVSTWRERAVNEDESDYTARDSAEEGEWDEDGNINMGKKDKTSSWMERYWVVQENNQGNVEQNYETIKLESDEETDICDKYISKVKENFEETKEWTDETGAEKNKTDGVLDHLPEKRVVFGECDEMNRRAVLEESESCDGEIRSFVSDGESYDEVESDLESLRELGSDWAQEEWEPFLQLQTLYLPKEAHLQSHEDSYSDSDEESVTLKKNGQHETSLPDSRRPQPLTCTSHRDSEQDLADEDSDDLSSGVFSSCSSTDSQSFNVDWSVSTAQTSSCYFEGLGVDIWVEDVSGESLKIRERPQVKIGHVAVGISEQISMRAFSLATLDGRLVSPDTEVCESGMWLQCVPAPDGNSSWDWRVRDGKLELQDYDEHLDTCSTLPL